MQLTPRLRKAALTAHVSCSVGWLGAVVAFLALAVAALASPDAETVHASYVAMELTASFALVPLAVASLLTGLVQSLASPWGLFRHYWVVFKLLINVFATALLLLFTRTLADLADAAAAAPSGELTAGGSPSPLLHAAAALALLLVATTLAVFKPRGLTPYGRRRERRVAASTSGRSTRRRGRG